MRKTARAFASVLSASFRADRRGTIAMLFFSTVAQGAGVVTAFMLKLITNAVVAHDMHRVIVLAVISGLIQIGQNTRTGVTRKRASSAVRYAS